MEWQIAQRRVFRSVAPKWDCQYGHGGRRVGVDEKMVSIFFSEIPNRIRAADVYDLFNCHGDVVEVVIPPKKNKLGKRYGFARFMNVEDTRMLAVRLDNIYR